MRVFFLISTLIFVTSTQAAIYGADNRRDISQTSSRWQQAAKAVAVSLPTHYLKDLNQDYFYHDEHDQRPYGEMERLCSDEKFVDQKSFGHCTSFLVHPKILVTAGHCFLPTGEVENQAHSYCENFSFWLGYNDSENPIHSLGSLIAKKDVAHCRKVIYATNNEQSEPQDGPRDFAILELEKPILHIKPLKVSLKELKKNNVVSTIGHPHGLPAKFSGHSLVLQNHSTTLSSFMDTLSGNSGGPAFNRKSEVVGLLISGHQYDSYRDKKKGCYRLNRCSRDGTRCDVDTDLENSNLLMKSQVWYPYIEKYLKETLLSH